MTSSALINKLRTFWYPGSGGAPKNILGRAFWEERERKSSKDILRLENIRLRSQLAQKEAERDELIKEINLKLKKTALNQSRYFADLSHEIKAPLAVIKSYLIDASGGEALDLEAFASQVQVLSQTVEDVILLSKLDSPVLSLDKKNISLTGIVGEICDELEPLALERKIKLKNFLLEEMLVPADVEKLKRALLEIIRNALLYNYYGGRVEIYGKKSGGGIRLIVLDTGRGIEKKDQSQIFTCFYSSGMEPRSRRRSGLGLPIAKKIIEKHGGTLRVKSREGKGTAVIVKIPSCFK